MTSAFLLQFAGSLVAVAALAGLAAWARVTRSSAPLDKGQALAMFAEEFPDQDVGAVWVAADGRSALARSGSLALLLAAVGDGWVARTTSWRAVETARRRGEHVLIATGDVAAPALRLRAQSWPPSLQPA